VSPLAAGRATPAGGKRGDVRTLDRWSSPSSRTALFMVLQSPPAQIERAITGESFAAHINRQRLEALRRLVVARPGGGDRLIRRSFNRFKISIRRGCVVVLVARYFPKSGSVV
jgi:hypothetical protein